MVIASGTSQRHVSAMADHLTKRSKQAGYGRPSIEGQAQSDWVLIDTGDIIVHLFRPEVRDFYALEKMWTAELTDDMPEVAEAATG
jgi:ribosome-associated protein